MRSKNLLTSSRRTISHRSAHRSIRQTSYFIPSSTSSPAARYTSTSFTPLYTTSASKATATAVTSRGTSPFPYYHVQPRSLSTSRSLSKGLQPDTPDPIPPNPEPTNENTIESVTDSEYHEISDQYLDTLVQIAEQKMEENPDDKFEVEFAAGVLTISSPTGTYVINKQPPNKQIWLSSPVSGPKRFDWVIEGSGQAVKEGTELDNVGDDGRAGGGKWVYLRDGSTLTDILKKELDIEVAPATEPDVNLGREGPGGSG